MVWVVQAMWWVGGSFSKYYNFVAPFGKLELARFSAWWIIQDGAECGNSPNVSLRYNLDTVLGVRLKMSTFKIFS